MVGGTLALWEAAWLGLVEGLTEFLPVSSTGHLILASALLGRQGDPALNSFNIIVQAGAILAVLGLYRTRVAAMLRGLLGRDPAGRALLLLLVVGFVPAGLLGPLLDDKIEAELFFPRPVAIALAVGGIAMIAVDRWRRRTGGGTRTVEQLTWRDALLIGCAQCLAMWPGTSRSMATILGGLAVGLTPAAAAEFSFLLALPTLGGASALKLLKGGPALIDAVGPAPLVVGLLVALVSAALAIRGLIAWLGRHGFTAMGLYRLLIAAAVLAAWS